MNTKKNTYLYIIKSNYILKKIFSHLKVNKSLKINKYNKKIQNRLELNINNYKNYSKIIIEIIPCENKDGIFINIKDGYEHYYHIYFDDNKEDIKRNYIKKGEKIKKIKIILDYELKSLSHLFLECNSIEKINFIQLYKPDINDMSCMFYKCSSLKELNFNNFCTDNVTNMCFMFYGCENLTSINISKFNTKKVVNMMRMFSCCNNLESIDLSKLDINYGANTTYMFLGCSNLKKVILNKNYFEDMKNLVNNNNKSNYYLTNSIKYKCTSEGYFERYPRVIKKELDLCQFESGFQIISLIDDTIIGVLEGPIQTSYENGFFFFKIKYRSNYPFRAPILSFITKIYHPNISEKGTISNCFKDWSPAVGMKAFIISIQSFLGTPFDDECLNTEAAKLYKENRNLYEDTVKEYVNKYANYSIYRNKLKEYEAEDIFKISEN
jgi:surface protein